MKRYKYPRTPHLPWSPGVQSDDKKLSSVSHFEGKRVYITEKLDGENTTMYRDYIHARSLDSSTNFTRSWVQQFHATIAHNIPKGWRIVGENVWAEHSIRYENLKSYFYPFAVFDENNYCLSYQDMLDFIGNVLYKDLPNSKKLPRCPKIITSGMFNLDTIEDIIIYPALTEGYVIRTQEGFHYNNFHLHVAKYVREGHVQTDQHWLKNAKRNGGLIL